MANDRFVVEDFIPQDKPEITTDMVDKLAYEEANTMPAGRATTDGTDRRMSVMGAALDSKDPNVQMERYNQIMGDLTRDGYSQALVDIKDIAKQREGRLAKLSVGNLLTDGSFSNLPPEQAIGGYKKYLQDTNEANLDVLYALNSYMQAEEQDPESNSVKEQYGIDGVRQMVEHKANVQAMTNDWYRENDYSYSRLTVGLIPSLLLYVDSVALQKELSQFEKASNQEISLGNKAKGLVIPSSIKRTMLQALDRMAIEDPAKYEEVVGTLISSMRDSSNVLIRNDGDASIRVEEVLAGDEGYATWMAALDNVASWVDVLMLGGVVRGIKNLIKSGGKLRVGTPTGKLRHAGVYTQAGFSQELIKHAMAAEVAKKNVVNNVAPASAAKITSNTNADMTRAMYEMASRDPEAAKAFFGTDSVADVVADAHAPQIGRIDGAVESKVYVPDKSVLAEVLDEGNPLLHNEADRARALENIKKDFSNAGELKLIPNMTTIETEAGEIILKEGDSITQTAGKVYVNAAFLLRGSGYKSVDNIKDIAEISFAKRGITKDRVTVMRKRTDGVYYQLADDVVFERAARAASDIKKKGELVSTGKKEPPRAMVSREDMLRRGDVNKETFSKAPKQKVSVTHREDGLTTTLDQGMTIVHGSGNPKLTINDIEIIRSKGQKQGKKGRIYGGLYGTSLKDAHQARGYAEMMGGTPTLYGINIKTGTKVLEKTGDITRLSKSYIEDLLKDGYGVVTGKDIRGRTEHVVIDKNAIQDMSILGSDLEHVSSASKNIPKPLDEFMIVVKDEFNLGYHDVIGDAKVGEKSLSEIRVGHNWFDRLFATWKYPGGTDSGWGSLNQHFFDAASTFKDKFMDQALGFAKDRASTITRIMMEDGKRLDKNFQKFTATEQRAMVDYFIKANKEQLAFNPEEALANGWSYDMIKHAYDFRRVWDEIYGLENIDAVRTFHNEGYTKFIDRSNGGTDLLVKELKKNQIGQYSDYAGMDVLDTEKNVVRKISKDELDRLYKTGGFVAQIRRPIDVDGQAAKFVITRNQAGYSFSRALRDDDVVIGYNPGYYAVRYKDPWFITRKIYDNKGNYLYEAALGTAKNRREAEFLTQNLMNRELEGSYHVDDFKVREGRNIDPVLRQQYNMDMHMAGGRSAQRSRGEQLLLTVNSIDNLGFDHIESPMESLVHSIKSISERISTREWFDTSKTRLLDSFSDFLPTDEFGRPRFPSSVTEIQNYNRIEGGEIKVAAARSAYNYIHGMEGAWINQIDELFKSLMHGAALKMATASIKHSGKAGKAMSYAEGALRWASKQAPIGVLNKLATISFLHSRPIRQFYLNAMQSLQLAGISNYDWFFRKGTPQFVAMTMRMAGDTPPDKIIKACGWTRPEFEKHFRGFIKSGFPYALDQQNMMRGILLDMADRQTKSKVYQAVTTPLHVSRRLGSDAGEYVNMLSAYLSFADKAKRIGKDISNADTLAEVQSSARNFTGNMNAAGDMPYNHNMLAPLFKFQQISHKLALTMVTNQHLTFPEKARLAVTNLALFGLPISVAVESGVTELYPDDPMARNLFMEGLYSFMSNEMIKLVSGSDTRLDFSSTLSPFNLSVAHTAKAILTTDVPTLMSKSAGAGMLFGNNPVLSNFAKELLNWIVPQEGMLDSDIEDVARAGLMTLKGVDDMFKIKYILENSQIKNSQGQIIDYNADRIATLGALAGIDPIEISRNRGVQSALYDDHVNRKENVKAFYKSLSAQMSMRGMDVHDIKRMQQAYAIGYKMFRKDPKFFEEWTKAVDEGAASSEWDMYIRVYEQLNTGNLDKTIEMTRNLPDTPQRDAMLSSLEGLKGVAAFNEEE